MYCTKIVGQMCVCTYNEYYTAEYQQVVIRISNIAIGPQLMHFVGGSDRDNSYWVCCKLATPKDGMSRICLKWREKDILRPICDALWCQVTLQRLYWHAFHKTHYIGQEIKCERGTAVKTERTIGSTQPTCMNDCNCLTLIPCYMYLSNRYVSNKRISIRCAGEDEKMGYTDTVSFVKNLICCIFKLFLKKYQIARIALILLPIVML